MTQKRRTYLAAFDSPTLGVKEGYSLNTLLVLFLIISFVGWLFEIALYLVFSQELINPGVLHGPWVPIYGVCSVGMLLVLPKWKDKPLLIFVLIIVLCGTVEFLTGNFLEFVTGAKWWDHSRFAFSLGSYVCIEGLLVFGFGGLFLIYVAAPACDKALARVPQQTQKLVLGVILFIFIIDTAYSLSSPNYAAPSMHQATVSFFEAEPPGLERGLYGAEEL